MATLYTTTPAFTMTVDRLQYVFGLVLQSMSKYEWIAEITLITYSLYLNRKILPNITGTKGE